MIDVSHKISSLRQAHSRGFLSCSPETLQRIRDNNLPKGELFPVARSAALLGSKKTPELIPHCHPVTIDNIEIDFSIATGGIEIQVRGKSISRTGIEMEVLTACSVAALTLYDLLKPIDKGMSIGPIELDHKSGGRSQAQMDVDNEASIGILTISDSVYQGQAEDKSGPLIRSKLIELGIKNLYSELVADDKEQIQKVLKTWVQDGLDFVFTTGGTGVGPRDTTVEAISELLTQEIPGIAEAIRSFGQQRLQRAMLSRSVTGRMDNTLVITLPGSRGGVQDGLDAVLPALFHARQMMQGGGHSD